MARPCASCKHEKRADIDRRIKQGRTFDDISRWLRDEGVKLSSAALGRHAQHMGIDRQRGQKPYDGDYLALVRDRAAENVQTGVAKVTVQHGLQAQQQIDARLKQAEDKRLVIILAQVLGGGYVPEAIEGEFSEVPLLMEPQEAEFVRAG